MERRVFLETSWKEVKVKKGKYIPVRATEAYRGSRVIAPLILIFGTSPL